ncbi:MAG: glycerol-3-phosphate 1-O-acyltransferase PlsY [Candidatus Rokuibacteriota bacterium]
MGAVPIGYLVGRAWGGGDIRRQGSGNIGATNVLRTLGRGPAILTLMLDVLKGYAAAALGGELAPGDAAGAAAVAAVAGNCWSPFLGFRGGKGVATGLGALLRLAPLATLAALPVFAAIVATTRWVSLGSLLSAACVPLGALALGSRPAVVVASAAIAALVIVRHRDNIGRLLAGKEHRLGERRAET